MIIIFDRYVYNDDIYWCIFHFFKILIFHFARGVKLQKMAQNDKKLCLCHFVCQELYIK